MSAVIIKCPHTGEHISTGIETDSDSFNKLPEVLMRSRCPSCGLEHAWWTREGRLAEPRNDPPPHEAA
jgi:hypothetical protein